MIGMQAASASAAEPSEVGSFVGGVLLLGAAVASVVVAARLLRRLRRGLPAVEPRPHPQATWGGGIVVLVMLADLACMVAAGPMVGREPSPQMLLVVDMAAKIAAVLVGIGMLRAGGASWAAIGLVPARWRDDLRLAFGGLALVVAPLLILAAALDRIVSYRHPIIELLEADRGPVTAVLVVLAAVVVAPVAEEFFFRRLLQGWLETRLPWGDGVAAIGLSAAAFAAAHLGHGLAAAPLFLFGVVLGVIARATGTLGPCVFLHALFNAVSVALLLAGLGTPAPAE